MRCPGVGVEIVGVLVNQRVLLAFIRGGGVVDIKRIPPACLRIVVAFIPSAQFNGVLARW